LGLLTALPLLAFAVVSPLAHGFSQKIGIERTVFIALLVLIAGTLLRSIPGTMINLWAGSFITGAAIAVCNVLVPAVVKRDFPDRMSTLTGAYSAVLGSFAGLGAGLAVPLAALPGSDWRWAMAAWALLAVPALIAWAPQLLKTRTNERQDAGTLPDPSTAATPAGDDIGITPSYPPAPVWKSPVAWQVTIYFGLQSSVFYILITWLPSILRTFGRSEVESGWDVFLFQGVGIVGSLVTPLLLNRGRDQRLTAAAPPLGLLTAVFGIIFLPQALLLWVAVAGLSCGSSLVIALSLFGLRTQTHHEASALSGMAQSLGYLMAASGPVIFGAIYGASATWLVSLEYLAVVAVGQGVLGLLAGRAQFTRPRTGSRG
ncbi:MFS transporter, partial [Arthrobacter sp. H14]|uniref:MFS transporter n=1 Tax=Arthrobacter sp. H14 TaxID=1312959 RepID=UPI0009DDCA86